MLKRPTRRPRSYFQWSDTTDPWHVKETDGYSRGGSDPAWVRVEARDKMAESGNDLMDDDPKNSWHATKEE